MSASGSLSVGPLKARRFSLYRIGALIAVPVIALVASFLYQRFYAQRDGKGNDGQAD